MKEAVFYGQCFTKRKYHFLMDVLEKISISIVFSYFLKVVIFY